jgi:ABC-type oligopeptide transport system substrate-binding subunit
MMKKRIIISGAVLSALVLTLAACSNNGNDGENVGSSNLPASLADSFFVLVAAMAATSPDDADARETDSVTASTPDDADTTSLGS